jgi:phenylpropionate dioxygenase-like ring-hydroxylating dioxygenase large terminal subunit
MMTPEYIEQLRQIMEYEAARTAPPQGWPHMPDVPAGRYVDPRYYDLEMQHIWRKSWLLASHIDEVPEPGCFRLWDNAGQPVVITHTEAGEIKAFYNTCSHRGAPVVTETSGKSRRLTCSYHGWLGPIADEWEEFQFDKCRLAARAIFDLDCNWKIAMEANTEVYHVRSIHPTTVSPILDDRRNVNTFYPHGHGRMIAPTPKGRSGMEAVEMPPGLPEFETVGEIARSCTQSYGLFPNMVAPLSQYAIPPIQFWPNGIDKCRMETWTMAPDWGDGEGPDMWTVNRGEELCQVLQEDTQFGLKIQKSMESYAFEGVPLSYQEARIYHWNEAADRMIGVENIPQELQVQQVIPEEWIYPNDPRAALI